MSVQTYCWCGGDYDKAKAQLAALKEENERLKDSESINEALLKQQNERLKARVAELAAIAHKQGVSVSFECDCFDGGKCGTGGFCDKCPLLKD